MDSDDGGGTSVRNRIGSGTFHGPVVMAGRVDRLILQVGAPIRGVGCGALALLGLVCLLNAPELPYLRRLGAGSTVAGLTLVGLAGVLYVVLSAREAAVRRREAVWLSEENLARAADSLARDLSLRYAQDERLTQVNDPYPLDVDWTTVHGSGPDAENDAGSGSGARLSIAAYFARLPTRRLVVLGGAGAGKSILALRLAEELVRTRTPDSAEPVAVVVPLASWSPSEGLIGWVAAQIAAAHPRACTPVRGAPAADVARGLIETRRVLPVLDGFDELPDELRADALEQLRASTSGRRPFVLTSREPEYRRHVRDGSVFERTEIELRPLSTLALDRYLNPEGAADSKWAPVLRRLTSDSDDAREVRRLRKVLGAPLMAGLAREAYGEPGTDPGELLVPGAFRTRRDVERHLLDAFLSVAYSASHDVRDRPGHWDPERARAWLAFLAARMKAGGEHEFAWWRLAEDVPRLLRTATLLPAFALCCLAVSFGEYGTPWWDRWVGLSFVGGYAVLALVLLGCVHVLRRRPHNGPRQLRRPTRQEVWAGVRRRTNQISAAVSVGALAFFWWIALISEETGMVQFLGLLTVVALWRQCRRLLKPLWNPADPSVSQSPRALLRADRHAAIRFGWLAYARDGKDPLPVGMLGFSAALLLLFWMVNGGRHTVSVDDWVWTVGSAYLGCVLASLVESAWFGFALARGYVALRGDLPRRLMAFLDDAHRRGVLRQSGGVYRFRHVELRDRLAAYATGTQPPTVTPGALPVHRTAAVLVVLMLLAVGGAVARGPFGMAAIPGPRTQLPAACDLLAADLPWITVDGRKFAGGRQHCQAGEQSPFAPDVQVAVSAVLYTSKGNSSGPYRALEGANLEIGQIEQTLAAGSEPATDAGLGDQSVRMVGRAAWLRRSDLATASYQASFVVRVDNILLAVTYIEEFATEDRVAEVARILTRNALLRAGLADAVPSSENDGRSLADVPRTRVPETDNRIASYERGLARPLHGAVWQDGERSYLWYLPDTYFVFRAPKHLNCPPPFVATGDTKDYICRSDPDFEKLGWVPKTSVEIRSQYCGPSCDSYETGAFLSLLPDHDRTEWRRDEKERTYYAIGSAADGTRYRMSMKRRWGFRELDKGKDHAFLLWVRVEVPDDDAALAQKIVNDIHAQITRFETTPQ
ncbi:NACHT domain-containing protein [Streptomyces sp. NPDC051243]|uniref:NACHT domain-containing protein n=1 Tax=Streptomyces sp. NPDC051243 TaxID=3365646 RepID=UPI00378B7308